jgi:hypothetical protein
MTTVILVHGTGVREEGYQRSFEHVRGALLLRRPDVRVKPCFWGGRLGAKLDCKGLSVPGGRMWRSEDRDWEEWQSWEVARWSLLEADPLYELRILAVEYKALAAKRKLVPGDEPFHERLESAARRLASPDPSLEPYFGDGRAIVLANPATQEAMLNADRDTQGGELGGAIARALLAEAIARFTEAMGEPPLMSGVRRDLLVEAIEDALRLQQLGIRRTLKKTSSRMALGLMTRAIMAARPWTLEASHPMAADVLLYLSRGDAIREFVQRTVGSVTGPAVVLAHSLGGIACLDLAIMQRLTGIDLLVTVGSQGPLLYELDVLTSLRADEEAPVLPPWINFYDLRDPLAYVAEALFPGRVRDVQVDNQSPFPGSHSGYFDNPGFYDLLMPLLP